MKFYLLFLSSLSLIFWSCQEPAVEEVPPNGFVRVNATLQTFNAVQPWDRNNARQRRGLGVLLESGHILTTAEMVNNEVYLELESADGTKKHTAEIAHIDRDANLALVSPVIPEGESSFLEELDPIVLASSLEQGELVYTCQLEDNGDLTETEAEVFSVEVITTYSEGKGFLSYLLKGSLQSSSNSFTLPVLHDGALAGVLTSYDSEEQIADVVSSEIIRQFLADAADGDYLGFPSLGIAVAEIDDQSFRDWLQLADDQGGLYLSTVAPHSAAEEAGLMVGDVLISIDGNELDRKGYYEDSQYGKLIWTHLIRGAKLVGDTSELKVIRDGEVLTKEATLRAATKKLVPANFDPRGPQYFLKGGIIIQQLTQQYLKAFGKEWSSRAPLNLLDILMQPEKYEDKMKEAVMITGVIPSQFTVGYESVRHSIIEKVNGVEIRKMSDLEKGFKALQGGIHEIELSEAPYSIYIDAKGADMVDKALLEQGLPALKRIYE